MKAQITVNPENYGKILDDISESEYYKNIGVKVEDIKIHNTHKATIVLNVPSSYMAEVLQNCQFLVKGMIFFEFLRD